MTANTALKGSVVPAWAVLAGAIALLIPSSQLFWTGWPRPWAPSSLVLVLPAFEEVPWPLWVGAPSVAFLLTAWLVLRRSRPPLPAVIVALTFAAGDIAYLATSFRYGMRYQGPLHVGIVGVTSLVGIFGAVGLLFQAWKRSSAWLSFWGWWVFFAWLAFAAFPYLGELP